MLAALTSPDRLLAARRATAIAAAASAAAASAAAAIAAAVAAAVAPTLNAAAFSFVRAQGRAPPLLREACSVPLASAIEPAAIQTAEAKAPHFSVIALRPPPARCGAQGTVLGLYVIALWSSAAEVRPKCGA